MRSPSWLYRRLQGPRPGKSSSPGRLETIQDKPENTSQEIEKPAEARRQLQKVDAAEPAKPVKPLVLEPDIVAPARKTPPEMAEEHKIASATILPEQNQSIEPIKQVKTHGYVSGISNIYEVNKGDTLWDISERYNGDPFNYPIIASDNEINNPHFILPGQRILLNPVGEAQNRILQ